MFELSLWMPESFIHWMVSHHFWPMLILPLPNRISLDAWNFLHKKVHHHFWALIHLYPLQRGVCSYHSKLSFLFEKWAFSGQPKSLSGPYWPFHKQTRPAKNRAHLSCLMCTFLLLFSFQKTRSVQLLNDQGNTLNTPNRPPPNKLSPATWE